MAQTDEQQKTKQERIARLRGRLALLDSRPPLIGILKGVLDLLADEL